MSHNKSEQTVFSLGIGNLFDQYREQQANQPLLVENPNTDNKPTAPGITSDAVSSATDNDQQIDLAIAEDLSSSVALNEGAMPPEARRALVSLLRHGVILATQKANLFETICRYQDDVRNHLADVYLKLILDQRAGVAFVAGLDENDDAEQEAVSLITRRTLSIYDTLLLLVLRKHYQERETAGEQRIIIDIERIESNLSPFLPLTNSTRSDRKKLDASLQKMGERHIVSSVRGSEDRYEITPIIRYVVNAEFLESMLADYQQLAIDAGLNTRIGNLDSDQEEQDV